MPTTDDYDKHTEHHNRERMRQAKFFRIIFWILAIAFIALVCLGLLWAYGLI